MRDRYGEPVPEPDDYDMELAELQALPPETTPNPNKIIEQQNRAPNPAAEQELVDLVNHDPEYRAWWKSWLNYCRQTLGINEDS